MIYEPSSTGIGDAHLTTEVFPSTNLLQRPSEETEHADFVEVDLSTSPEEALKDVRRINIEAPSPDSYDAKGVHNTFQGTFNSVWQQMDSATQTYKQLKQRKIERKREVDSYSCFDKIFNRRAVSKSKDPYRIATNKLQRQEALVTHLQSVANQINQFGQVDHVTISKQDLQKVIDKVDHLLSLLQKSYARGKTAHILLKLNELFGEISLQDYKHHMRGIANKFKRLNHTDAIRALQGIREALASEAKESLGLEKDPYTYNPSNFVNLFLTTNEKVILHTALRLEQEGKDPFSNRNLDHYFKSQKQERKSLVI